MDKPDELSIGSHVQRACSVSFIGPVQCTLLISRLWSRRHWQSRNRRVQNGWSVTTVQTSGNIWSWSRYASKRPVQCVRLGGSTTTLAQAAEFSQLCFPTVCADLLHEMKLEQRYVFQGHLCPGVIVSQRFYSSAIGRWKKKRKQCKFSNKSLGFV